MSILMKQYTWVLIVIYGICTILDSYASEHQKRRSGKILLIPLLIIMLMMNGWKEYLLYGALTVCWCGDIFLIHKNEKRNMAGMFCFLFGHVLYLILFAGRVHSFSIVLLLSGIIFYLCMMLFYFRRIWCHASENLKIPSMIYMLTIFCMSFVCFLSVPSGSLWITWTGTVFFLISDMLISDQLFRHLPQKGVMETYGTAQFLIVIGLLLA